MTPGRTPHLAPGLVCPTRQELQEKGVGNSGDTAPHICHSPYPWGATALHVPDAGRTRVALRDGGTVALRVSLFPGNEEAAAEKRLGPLASPEARLVAVASPAGNGPGREGPYETLGEYELRWARYDKEVPGPEKKHHLWLGFVPKGGADPGPPGVPPALPGRGGVDVSLLSDPAYLRALREAASPRLAAERIRSDSLETESEERPRSGTPRLRSARRGAPPPPPAPRAPAARERPAAGAPAAPPPKRRRPAPAAERARPAPAAERGPGGGRDSAPGDREDARRSRAPPLGRSRSPPQASETAAPEATASEPPAREYVMLAGILRQRMTPDELASRVMEVFHVTLR